MAAVWLNKFKIMKQTIEIEVPEGKKAIIEGNHIRYIDVEYWKSIKTFDDALHYCYDYPPLNQFVEEYDLAGTNYAVSVAKLRLIIAALTNNEKLSLTSGTVYYPALQLYKADYPEPVIGKDIIGTIITEEEKYVVVSITAHTTCLQGLGDFPSDCHFSSVSTGINIGLPSKEIAGHLTKYFGKLLFEAMYGMCNCEWEWVE